VIKDAGGEIVELRCTYDPATRGVKPPMAARVRPPSTGSAPSAPSSARAACTTVSSSRPIRTSQEGQTYLDHLNPELVTSSPATSNPASSAPPPARVTSSSVRAYFCVDKDFDGRQNSSSTHVSIARLVAKIERRNKSRAESRPASGHSPLKKKADAAPPSLVRFEFLPKIRFTPYASSLASIEMIDIPS